MPLKIVGTITSRDLRVNEELVSEVFPVNPDANEIEGAKCDPDIDSILETIDRSVIGTHPDVSADIVRQVNFK